MLVGCAFSVLWLNNQRVENRVQVLATEVDKSLLVQTPAQLNDWLSRLMPVMNAEQLSLHSGSHTLLMLSRQEHQMIENEPNRFIQFDVPLIHQSGVKLRVLLLDPAKTWLRSITAAYTLGALLSVVLVMSLLLLMMHRWLTRQWRGMEQLEVRAEAIINGDRQITDKKKSDEWPPRASRALDVLLGELQEASEQRLRIDTLIRTFVAQDGRTGLNNRLFFDNQLATLLEDQEAVGTHGVVMMVRLPDLDTLSGELNPSIVEEYLFDLVNMLSTFVLRYPGTLFPQ